MLPQSDDGFQWVRTPAGPALQCRALQHLAPHVFTTRTWALGSRPAAATDDEPWAEVAREVGVSPARLHRLRQVHGSSVVVRRADRSTASGPEWPEADVLLSDEADAAIAVQAADCVSLLIADWARPGTVAAVHAGWRGAAARAPMVAVAALVREFGSHPRNLVAAVGPSIGACCYEVGDDVRDRFTAQGCSASELERWFLAASRPSPANPSMPGVPGVARAGHWYFDGWASVRDQLVAVGVPADRVHIARLCTASHPGTFCSYRQDGVGAGRMAAAIRAGVVRRPSPPHP